VRIWADRRSSPRTRRRSRPSSVVLGGTVRRYPFLRRFYQHRPEIGPGLQRALFYILVASLVYGFVLSDAGVVRTIELRRERDRLKRRLSTLERRQAAIDSAVEALRRDPFAIEKLGRERYGLIRPGEKVIQLVPLPDSSARED